MPIQPIKTEDTTMFWSERARKTLTNSEAEEVIANVTSFFKILQEWEQKEIQENKEKEES